MRIKYRIGLLALALSFTFMSCEEIEELTQIEIDTEVSETVNIVIPDDSLTNFEGTSTIKLENSEEMNQYLLDLKDLNVTKISYKITNYTGPDDGTLSGNLFFEEMGFELDIPETQLKETSDNEILNTIDATDEQLDQIASYLIASKQATLTARGEVSEAPMEFDFTIIAALSATAEFEKD